MLKRFFIVLTLVAIIFSLNAIYVEVGSGVETSSYIPTYGWYDYGWSRTIYLSGDLLNEMEITQIGYNVNNSPANYSMLNQSIYIKHTSEISIASVDYIDPTTDDTYELVFSGDITWNGTGWHDIIFDSSFAYNGTDNLEVLVLNNDGSYITGQPIFTATSATPERAIFNYSDGTFPATAGTLSGVYPNTRFHFVAENEPGLPILTSPANGSFNVSSPTELIWTNGPDTDWVKVYFSDNMVDVSTSNATALIADDYTQQTIAVNDLESLTTYYWRVVAANNVSEYLVPSQIWSFTTSAEEGSIVIGNGTAIDTHLPLEPFYGYSLTQTIYNQEWINIENQRIEEVSFYYNGNGAWTEDNIQVYLGHTELDEFANGDSWLPLSDFILVYDGPFTVTTQEGWVTISLTLPFNYNNEDNLVIAFEANTQGYFGSADEFYGSTVTGNKSIYHYNDGTNFDFITPPTGTVQSYIANVLLTMGDIPTTPQLMVTPDEYNWDDTIINTIANTVTFSMRNTGLGTLTINSVSIDQDVDFIFTDTNTYPTDITSNVVQFTVAFNPQTVGDFEANITINDSENGDTVIPLTGTGYDAMIYNFPHLEDFEGLLDGEMPQDWSTILLNGDSWSAVGVTTWGGFESNNNLRLYNSGAASPELYAITPPIDDLANRRIRFMGKSSTESGQIIIGTAENNTGEINFTARDTISFSTTWNQYVHNFNGVEEDISFIALKFLGTGAAYVTLNIDNFFIEQIPTGPAIVVTQDTLDFGDVYLNRNGVAHLIVENWGISPLEIDLVSEGTELSFNPISTTVQPESNQIITVNLDPFAEGAYSGSFEVLSNDTAIPSITVNTTAFILPPLPDNIAIVGTGTEVNLSMPIEPFYGYTYSQVIYYAGEIVIENQRIEKISWQYNGAGAFGPDDFIIYMGHTTASEFANSTDWIDISEFMEVYNGTLTAQAQEGWIEFELDIPFVYDNTQNLVVAVEENTPGYHSSNNDFYCTLSTSTRGIVYYSDITNPDPIAPPAANYLQNAYANIKLEFGEIPNAPDLTVYPANSLFEMTPVDGTSLEKTITMRSIGLQDVTIADAPTITGAHADQFTITTDNNTYPLALP
nr:choice-of-anchor D domain-containing protein [bacterium]